MKGAGLLLSLLVFLFAECVRVASFLLFLLVTEEIIGLAAYPNPQMSRDEKNDY
jgi:hypothetical protein